MFDVPRSPLSGQGIERWDRPSIANVAFVDGLLAQMIEEVRVVLFGLAEPAINPQRELPRVAEKWARILGAGNPNFAQKMTPKGQDEWLRAHGYATGEAGTGASVLALVKETLERFVQAYGAHADGRIGDEQANFWLDAAAEDCSCMLRGLENRAE